MKQLSPREYLEQIGIVIDEDNESFECDLEWTVVMDIMFDYADQMMKERGPGNEISTNLKNFIGNCEDIPDDIKKVIDKEFFNML